MEFCLVYVPAKREIFRLNPSAWFVLGACEGRTEAQVTRAYHTAVPDMAPAECARQVRKGIAQLCAMGIIEEAPATARSSTGKSTRRARDAHTE